MISHTLPGLTGLIFLVAVIGCLIGGGTTAHMFLTYQSETRHECRNLLRQINQREELLASQRERMIQLDENLRRLQVELQREQDALTRAKANLPDPAYEKTVVEEMERLQRVAADLNAEIQRLRDACKDAAEIELSLKNLAKLLESLNAERNRLLSQREQVRQEADRQSRVFSVAALGGSRASRNRPAVFAECSREGLILQPRAKRLSPTPSLKDRQAFLSRVKKTPYVVFLIRPDGFSTFGQYRCLATTEAGIPVDIGFEPINADWTLVYPDRNGLNHAKSHESQWR